MPYHNYHLPYKMKTSITMWKLETAKGYFVYVSLLKQQGNSDFEFISVCFSALTVGYLRYQHTVLLKSYDLKIESFSFLFEAVSTKKNITIEEKIHSGLFLSLVITGTHVIDIISYPSSSLKYHLTSILTVFKKIK